MNMEQVKSVTRSVVIWVGGILSGWAIARGWDISGLMSLFQSEAVIGLLAGGVMMLWGILAKRIPGLIVAAAKVTEVKQITITDPALAEAVKTAASAAGTSIKSAP